MPPSARACAPSGTIREHRLTMVQDQSVRLSLVASFPLHAGRVVGVLHTPRMAYIVSVGADRKLLWSKSVDGSVVGAFLTTGEPTCLAFDYGSLTAFVGDYSGEIAVVRIPTNDAPAGKPTTMKGHEGSTRCLDWDPLRRWLYSGGYDGKVIVWNLSEGIKYDLTPPHRCVPWPSARCRRPRIGPPGRPPLQRNHPELCGRRGRSTSWSSTARAS